MREVLRSRRLSARFQGELPPRYDPVEGHLFIFLLCNAEALPHSPFLVGCPEKDAKCRLREREGFVPRAAGEAAACGAATPSESTQDV